MKDIFIYNETFISLLNLIEILIQRKIKPLNIKNNEYTPNLFENSIKLEIKEDDTIITRIINNTNKKVFSIIYYVFLSKEENKELIIYYFYLNALKYKDKILNMRKLKCVTEALRISKYVGNENHKYKGFVRFKELENKVLYAEIEPINNILEILSKHFINRLKNEYWIIKDVRRNILALYDTKEIIFCNGDDFTLLTNKFSKEEKTFQELWFSFYDTIGIKTRKNDRCRKNFMPKRYWKYIIEMRKEI